MALRRYFGKLSPLAIGNLVGHNGELVIDETTDYVYVMDGITPGGQRILYTNVNAAIGNIYANVNPTTDNYFTLGNSSNRWSNLYISNAIILDGASLTIDNNGNLNINGTNLLTQLYSNAALQSTAITSLATYANANSAAYFANNYSGNITAGNLTVSGNLFVTGNIITQNYETISKTEYANSIIASGNINASGNVSATYYSGNGYYLSGVISNYSNTNVAAYLANSIVTDINITGNILPSGNAVYSLGSIANQWKSLYVSNNTIYIGGTAVQVANGSLLIGGNTVTSGTAYSNSNVASYLPTYAGNINAAFHIGNGYYLTGIAQSSTYGNSNVGVYLPTDSTIIALYSNAATQANLISVINANITAANSAISTLTSNAASQASDITILYSNAATQANLISAINANITAANSAILTINNNVTAANSAISTLQTQVYSNTNVAAYLPTYSGNFTANNVVLSGNLTVNGSTTTINANSIIINDNIIYVANSNPSYSIDIGFVGHFTAGTYQHTGLVRQASSNVWKLFSNISAEPSSVIDFTNAVYDSLQTGAIISPTITDIYSNLGILTVNAGAQANSLTTLNNSVVTLASTVATIQAGTGFATTQQIQAANSSITTLNANLNAANINITNLQSNTGTIASNVNTLFTNVSGLSTNISTLFANAASQASDIATLYSNAASQATTLNTLISNAATQESEIALLNANLTAANSAAVTANNAVTAYANSLNSAMTANIVSTNSRVTVLEGNVVSINNTLVGLVGGAFSYGNANVATYLPQYNGNITAGNVIVSGNISATNLLGSGQYLTGLSNNSTITSINANITAANSAISTLTSNAASQASDINVLYSNAATQASLITTINSNITAANSAISTLQTQVYSNSNVAAYLPTYSGNSNAAFFTGNGYYLTGLPATYGNTQVSAYYVANTVATGNVQILNNGNIRLPTGGYISDSYGPGVIVLAPNTTASATAGVLIGGSGYLLSSNGSRNATLNYGSVSGQFGIYQLNVYGNQQNAIVNGGSNNYGNIGSISTFFGNAFVSNIYSQNYLYPNGISILSGIGGTYSNSNVASYLPTYSGNSNAAFFTGNGYYLTGIASGSTYSNSNVAAYLVTYNGNISAGNLSLTSGASGNISGTGYVVAGNMVANTGVYGNSYYWYNNNATLASTITGTYANANVAGYMPTYTGNVNAGNIILTNLGNIIAATNSNLSIRTYGLYNIITIYGIAGGYNSPPYTNQSLTGGNGSGMTASYSSVGGYVSQASLVVTNPGTGYKNGDILTLPGGAGSTVILSNYNQNITTSKAYNWTFSTYDGNITVPGNIIMPSNSYILGDFTNSTFGYRTAFQTITANSSTGIYALPSGTSTGASWQAVANSNPNNASKIFMATNSNTDVQLGSGINGTGTYLPLSFYNNNAAQMVIYPNGNIYMSNANPITTSGNVSVGNLVATGNVTANYIITTGSYGNISGANVITANTFIGTTATISGNLYSSSVTGKSAAIVAQNTAVTMDNIKVQWLNNGSANANQLQIGSLSGTPSILYTYVYQSGLGGGTTGGSSGTSLSTTYANIGSTSGTAGDMYMVTATVGTNAYRVSAITGSGYSNNLISIERLV